MRGAARRQSIPLKCASLGSGSEGNALLIASDAAATPKGRTIVMIDCGFNLRETERRLARLGVDPTEIAALFVTHEHQDHVGGVFKLARRYAIPVWLTAGTYHAVANHCSGVDIRFCRDGLPVMVGGLALTPYTVPHDAREPVQYTVSDGRSKLGVLTDAGHATPYLVQALGGCHLLIVECNHDTRLLAGSSYPASLKERIGGNYGHLSNQSAASILATLDRSRLRTVVAAHLSRQNNTADLAHAAIAEVLNTGETAIVVACQDAGFDWIETGD